MFRNIRRRRLLVNYLRISRKDINDLKDSKIIIPEYINNYELSYI